MSGINEGFRQQFSDNIERTLQQKGSLLRGLVREEEMIHEIEYHDGIHSSEAFIRDKDQNGYNIDHEIGANNASDNYKIKTPEIYRKQLAAQQIIWHTYFDSGNKLNLLLEPNSFQIKDAAWALGRQYDHIILKALVSSVNTGTSGGSKSYFPIKTQIVPLGVGLSNDKQNNLIVIGEDDGVLGCLKEDNVSVGEKERYGGLTVAKLLKTREILKKHMYNSDDKKYFVCSESHISQLLTDPYITSADYNTVRTLSEGSINSFAGFQFITTELLGGIRPSDITKEVGFTIRDCFAFTESSILFGRVKGAYSVNADRLPERLDSVLVKAMDSVGAVRMNDKGVVCIKCLEKYDESHASFAPARENQQCSVSTVPSYLYGFSNKLKDTTSLEENEFTQVALKVAEKYKKKDC